MDKSKITANAQNSEMHVYSSMDYSRFHILNGNRNVNQLHLRRLKQSFKERYLISPILVNEKYQIIDGQHRFFAAKELELPINYIICNGYGLTEVQVLNTNSSNWKLEDYLVGYCDLGIPTYLTFRKFMQDFPDFGIQASTRIITLLSAGRKQGTLDGHRIHDTKAFQDGTLEIPDIEKSYDIAEKIMMFKPYYSGFNRGTFVSAMLPILQKEDYNHEEMIHKLSQQPSSLTDCANVNQYRLLIEEIYNYRRRDKVGLRFF